MGNGKNMKIFIECKCGNKCYFEAVPKKTTLLKDNLNKDNFSYLYNNGNKDEIVIQCDKCNTFIYLDMN